MSDWTRDADGNFVDWTKPPYKRGGVIDFVLPGEKRTTVNATELRKRRDEYLRLTRRAMKRHDQKSPGGQ